MFKILNQYLILVCLLSLVSCFFVLGSSTQQFVHFAHSLHTHHMPQSFWRLNNPLLWLYSILILTAIIYAPALTNQLLHFDDNVLITDNWAIATFTPLTIAHVFSSYDPELYIPLTLFTYQVIHLFFGVNPVAYHTVSLFLHLINICLVYWVIVQLFSRRSVALMTAALFALHPLQSEAVLWASAFKDLLSSMFFFLSLGCYLSWKKMDQSRWFFGSIAAFFLGLLCKVSIAPFAVIIIAIDLLQQRKITRRSVQEKWPFFALAGVFILIALGGKSQSLSIAGPAATILLAIKASIFYIQKMVWPTGLSILYPQLSIPSLSSPEFFVPLILLIALAVLFFWSLKKMPVIAFAIMFYFLFIVPSFSSVYKNGFYFFASDRYAYIPSLGFFLLVALAVDRLWKYSQSIRIALFCTASFILVSFVVLVHDQTVVWKNTQTLFERVLLLYPDSAIAHNNLGAEYGATEAGLREFERARQLDPNYAGAIHNVAAYYFKTGDTVKMKQAYNQIADLVFAKPHATPEDVSYLFEYAEYLDMHGDSEQAIELLKKATELLPDFSEARYNLGIKYQKAGRYDLALPELERAVELENYKPDFLYHLAAVDGELGRLQLAADLLERLLKIDPHYENAQRHLDAIRGMMKQ